MFLEFKEKSFVWFLSLPAPETMKTQKRLEKGEIGGDRKGREEKVGKGFVLLNQI